MATDCLVVPLWRYFAGDYTTSLERLGGADKVTRVEVDSASGKARVGLRQRHRGRKAARALMRDASVAAGQELSWNDEGDCVYSQQYHGDDALHLYAQWYPNRDRLPEWDPEAWRYASKGSFRKEVFLAGRERSLLHHASTFGFQGGFVFPVHLDRPLRIRPQKVFWGEIATNVLSAPRSLEEIEELCGMLSVSDPIDWDEWKGHPFAAVAGVLSQARTVLRLSVTHELPIIFC